MRSNGGEKASPLNVEAVFELRHPERSGMKLNERSRVRAMPEAVQHAGVDHTFSGRRLALRPCLFS